MQSNDQTNGSLPGVEHMAGQAAQVLQSLKMNGNPSIQQVNQLPPHSQVQDPQGAPRQLPMGQAPLGQMGPVPNQYNFMQHVLLVPPVQNPPYMPGPMSSPMPMIYPMVPQQMPPQVPQSAPISAPVSASVSAPVSAQSTPQPAENTPYPMSISQPSFAVHTQPAQQQALQPLLPKPNVTTQDNKALKKLRKEARILESELHMKMTECINHHDEQLKLNEILNRITSENQTLLAMLEKLESELKPAAPAQLSPLTKEDLELYEMVAAGTHIG